tara:strand:- start:255 stop:920 length:666 start_codon:yes stop_codon:yes gene_type:complete
MISDFIDNNIDVSKAGPTFFAMSYYNDLRSQQYNKNAIFILQDKLDWLGDSGTEQKMDEDLCASAVFAYVELCMAELMYIGMREIKSMNELYEAAYVRENINESFQHYKDYAKFPSNLKRDLIKASLWNYEDEVLSLQNSVKFTLANVMREVVEINSTMDKITLNDMLGIYQKMKDKLKDTSLPEVVDMEEDEKESLDLIASAMFSDDYIGNVVDFCLKKN